MRWTESAIIVALASAISNALGAELDASSYLRRGNEVASLLRNQLSDEGIHRALQQAQEKNKNGDLDGNQANRKLVANEYTRDLSKKKKSADDPPGHHRNLHLEDNPQGKDISLDKQGGGADHNHNSRNLKKKKGDDPAGHHRRLELAEENDGGTGRDEYRDLKERKKGGNDDPPGHHREMKKQKKGGGGADDPPGHHRELADYEAVDTRMDHSNGDDRDLKKKKKNGADDPPGHGRL